MYLSTVDDPVRLYFFGSKTKLTWHFHLIGRLWTWERAKRDQDLRIDRCFDRRARNYLYFFSGRDRVNCGCKPNPFILYHHLTLRVWWSRRSATASAWRRRSSRSRWYESFQLTISLITEYYGFNNKVVGLTSTIDRVPSRKKSRIIPSTPIKTTIDPEIPISVKSYWIIRSGSIAPGALSCPQTTNPVKMPRKFCFWAKKIQSYCSIRSGQVHVFGYTITRCSGHFCLLRLDFFLTAVGYSSPQSLPH